MGATKIQWATRVWNPVTGCSPVSPGCDNCYAFRMAKRLAGRCGYPKNEPFRVTFHPERLDMPSRWRKPQRVFVNSMGDLFHEQVPFEWIEEVFQEIRLSAQHNEGHSFMILTKRPERLLKNTSWEDGDPSNGDYSSGVVPMYKLLPWPKNLWLGVTCETQEQADKRIPLLLQIPAAVRFISVEPMLGLVVLPDEYLTGEYAPVDFGGAMTEQNGPKINWVICGGESGPGARPMHPDWVRSLHDQCQDASVPFYFKQWGEFIVPEDSAESCRVCGCTWNNACEGGCSWVEPGLCSNCVGKEEPSYRAVKYVRVGKKAAGRLMDGRTWSEFPEVVKS